MSAERLRQAADRLDRPRLGSCCLNVGRPECKCNDLNRALAAWLRDVAYALDRHPSPTVVPNGHALAVADAILGSPDLPAHREGGTTK